MEDNIMTFLKKYDSRVMTGFRWLRLRISGWILLTR